MVGSLVRFLFTCCEELQTHSFAGLTRSFAILHNIICLFICLFLYSSQRYFVYFISTEISFKQ